MIVEWAISLARIVSDWAASLFPNWTVPDFLATLSTKVNGVLASLSGVGVWADWSYILAIVTAVVAVWVIAFAVKVALRIAAFIPFFGGSG